MATLARRTDYVDLRVEDRIHDCTAAPGTGTAMLAALSMRSPDATREELTIGRWRAVLITEPGRNRTVAEGGGIEPAARTLRFWVADRCLVELREEPPRPSTEVLSSATLALDLAPLEEACASRPTGWTPPALQ